MSKSLKDTLSRTKDKWKERLNVKSRNPSPTPPIPATPELSTTLVPVAGLSSTIQTADSIAVSVNNDPSLLPTSDGVDAAGRSVVWPAVRTLLAVLESSSDAFNPIKSAISGLNESIDIYERAAEGRKDYDELRDMLGKLLEDLATHIAQPMDPMMTNSVKLLCSRIEAELKDVEAKQARNIGRRLIEATDTQDEILECYRRIHGHLERLIFNADLSLLNTSWSIKQVISEQATESRLKSMAPALSAIYNSAESDAINRGECAPGTREPQINLLLEWARDPAAGQSCWMNGMAGTGKTTIAYSVCSKLDSTFELGASFFCSRAIPECRQVKYIIPSISYQLARFSLPFRCALNKVLESDPDAHTRTLKVQYQKLIIEPLMEVQKSLPTNFIIVIDALDECQDETSLGQILDLLLTSDVILPIRYLISSRPEPEIYYRMAGNARLILHDLDLIAVKSDIERYMRLQLKGLPLIDSQWSRLLERCGVLFIYAFTICRYLKQAHETHALEQAINTILSPAGVPDDNPVDDLYSTILSAAFSDSRMGAKSREGMKTILETVICAQVPLTSGAMVELLRLRSTNQVNALLKPFRSVLNVTADTGLITTLHASFPDYMLSPDRSGQFHCVPGLRHYWLATSCLQVIDEIEPKFNICDLASSYVADSDIEMLGHQVSESISAGLMYACLYWSTHLCLGEYRNELVDHVRKFLTERLLIWMEVLNLTKYMHVGPIICGQVGKWCSERLAQKDLIELAHDSRQFVSVYSANPICQSTPHIYVSLLPFWPRSRPVSEAYMPQTRGTLNIKGSGIDRRQLELIATWKVSRYVRSISLSLDGTRIAAAANNAVYMLNASTGDEMLHLQDASTEGIDEIALCPSGVWIAFASQGGLYLLDVTNETTQRVSEPDSAIWSIVFSPNGSMLAIGLSSGNIHLCTSPNGELVFDPLQGHTDGIRSISFSPNGLFIASGSDDETIRVWDVRTGQIIGSSLIGHTRWLFSVSYSPDSLRLASTSRDGTIRVWDPLTGQILLGPLKRHSHWVRTVAFSPNGAFIASGSDDMTIQICDAQTGQTILGPLQGHTDFVKSVIFSPDSTQLFSCSHDGTIRLWNAQVLNISSPSRPDFPNNFCSIRYSPDGSQVVSGSYNGNVCIWDVQTGEMVLGPLQGHSRAVCTVDYSPDGAYIASASRDCTLRVWSAQDGSDIHGPIMGHTDWVNCVRFSPNGAYLVSGSDDRTVRIWDVATGQPILEPFKGHSGWVNSVAFSPNGALVASGSYDCTIRVWDINTGQTVVGPLQGHSSIVSSVEFSPDGSHILSGSWDGSIRVWDAQTGQQLLAGREYADNINSVSYSPDSLLIVSGSNNKTTQIWDAQTGDLLLTLAGHSDRVQSIQFSPDGSQIVSCSNDTIRLWDMSSRLLSLQLNKSKDLDDADRSIDPALGPWSLDDSGWLVDRRQRRLLWVPEDLRIIIPHYSNDLVISKQGSLKLDFNRAHLGEQWTSCYQPR